jgi:hypothetical protein
MGNVNAINVFNNTNISTLQVNILPPINTTYVESFENSSTYFVASNYSYTTQYHSEGNYSFFLPYVNTTNSSLRPYIYLPRYDTTIKNMTFQAMLNCTYSEEQLYDYPTLYFSKNGVQIAGTYYTNYFVPAGSPSGSSIINYTVDFNLFSNLRNNVSVNTSMYIYSSYNQFNSSSIGLCNLSIDNISFGVYYDTFSPSNNKVNLTGLNPTTNYTYSVSSPNFLTQTFTNVNASNNRTVYMYPTSYINVSYYQTNGSILTVGTPSTILIQSDNQQIVKTLLANTNNITDSTLTYNEQYQIISTIAGYKTTTVAFNLTDDVITNGVKIYMPASATSFNNLTINTYRVGNVALDNVFVTIEQYVNNTWQIISSGYTDNAGRIVLGVDVANSAKITFSKEGYDTITQINTQAVISSYVASSLSVILTESGTPSMINSATYVDWSYTPTNSTLIANDTQNFLMTTSIQTGTLEYSRVRFYYNGTVLATYQLNSSTGGQFGLTINTTPYINKTISLLYEYKKPNFALVQNIRGYFVISANQIQNQSIQKSADWIKTVDIDARILYWFGSIVVFIILLITFIRNMSVIAIGATIWSVAWGYYFLPEAFMYISLFAGMIAIVLLVSRSRR